MNVIAFRLYLKDKAWQVYCSFINAFCKELLFNSNEQDMPSIESGLLGLRNLSCKLCTSGTSFLGFQFLFSFDFLITLKVGVKVLAPNLFTAKLISMMSTNIMASCSYDELKLCICSWFISCLLRILCHFPNFLSCLWLIFRDRLVFLSHLILSYPNFLVKHVYSF